MIITLVVDQFGRANNGTTVTAMRLCDTLRAHGHTVRIVTASDVNEDNVYTVDQYHFPVFEKLIESQGMIFASADEDVLRKAIEGSDVVHFLMPFKLCIVGKKIADELHIPSTAAFHVQPENITSTIYLNKSKWLNNQIYKKFRTLFFDKFTHVHCPSEMIKKQLVEHHYKAKIHVISNGVSDNFHPIEVEKPEELKDKFVILMVGRYSREKRQDLIIDAIKKSKYEKNIQLILAGKGPWKDTLEKLGEDLTNKIMFKFVDQEELLKIINYSDLYIHSSDVEIEAISCMEAFTCGLVPIISDSKLSATNQFALTEHNLFKHGDSSSLAHQIDFFIENKDYKDELSARYIEYAKQYSLDNCVRQIENMFEEAIRENK